MKSVRIIKDETMPEWYTKVVDVETGEELEHVFKVELVFEASKAPVAILHMYLPYVDVKLDASVVHHCPLCNREVNEPTEQTDEENGEVIPPGLAIVGEYRPSDEMIFVMGEQP